jgi:hypothetical protein
MHLAIELEHRSVGLQWKLIVMPVNVHFLVFSRAAPMREFKTISFRHLVVSSEDTTENDVFY